MVYKLILIFQNVDLEHILKKMSLRKPKRNLKQKKAPENSKKIIKKKEQKRK